MSVSRAEYLENGGEYIKEHRFSNRLIPTVNAPSGVVGLQYIRCEKVGNLIRRSGTVTRRKEIRPEHIHGCFTKSCYMCSSENKDVEVQFRYTEIQNFRPMQSAVKSGMIVLINYNLRKK
eukprot:1169888_1